MIGDVFALSQLAVDMHAGERLVFGILFYDRLSARSLYFAG